MYTLTIFTLIAVVVGIAFAILVPTLRRQMRAVPGSQQRPGDWRSDALPPQTGEIRRERPLQQQGMSRGEALSQERGVTRRDTDLPQGAMDPDRPKQP